MLYKQILLHKDQGKPPSRSLTSPLSAIVCHTDGPKLDGIVERQKEVKNGLVLATTGTKGYSPLDQLLAGRYGS